MKDQKYSSILIESLKSWPEEDKQIISEGIILMDLHREIEMFAEVIGSRLGLSARQMEILEILYNHPEKQLTPAQLADEVHLTRSTMTGNLDTLQDRGYISRGSHPNDRRMILINLTKEGAEFCKEIIPQRYSDILKVMKVMSSEERDHLKIIYTKLLNFTRKLATEDSN